MPEEFVQKLVAAVLFVLGFMLIFVEADDTVVLLIVKASGVVSFIGCLLISCHIRSWRQYFG